MTGHPVDSNSVSEPSQKTLDEVASNVIEQIRQAEGGNLRAADLGTQDLHRAVHWIDQYGRRTGFVLERVMHTSTGVVLTGPMGSVPGVLGPTTPVEVEGISQGVDDEDRSPSLAEALGADVVARFAKLSDPQRISQLLRVACENDTRSLLAVGQWALCGRTRVDVHAEMPAGWPVCAGRNADGKFWVELALGARLAEIDMVLRKVVAAGSKTDRRFGPKQTHADFCAIPHGPEDIESSCFKDLDTVCSVDGHEFPVCAQRWNRWGVQAGDPLVVLDGESLTISAARRLAGLLLAAADLVEGVHDSVHP